VKAIALALAVAAGFTAAVASCVKAPGPSENDNDRAKRNEITALWTQIRQWRREAGMGLEPSAQSMFQMRGKPFSEVKRVCPDGHVVPRTCDDVCSLADAICDNAETICNIAAELGPDDHYAQEKCNSAKASCNEAKQRCCDCSAEPAP
jgi:hypothetical protein